MRVKVKSWWPWPWGGDDDDVEPDQKPDLNPVLLVPGIGGSILHAVSEKGHKERIWVRLFAADHEFRAKLFSVYDPLTGKTNSLDKNTTIEVPDDRSGLYSCDILDPAVIFRMDDVYYFHDLITQMTEWGYEEGTTLFGFGYDFRQSNRLSEHMEKFKTKLQDMYKASGGKKVDIISHSMGGILVKSFLALHHDFFEQYVNSWIAVAAPFQGAPGFIMDCLLTGVEFVKGWQRQLFVAKWSMHQLLIECPSVYELMASRDFPWMDPPELRLWRKGEANSETSSVLERYGPDDYLEVMSAALRGNTMNFNGATIPTPMNTEILKWAEKTRLLLEVAELPASVKFFNIVGTSYDTPFHTCYGSKENPIEQLTDILALEADFSFVEGDGTVPIESSMADGLNAEMRIGIPGDHRGILNDERLFRLLKHFLKVGDPDPFYNPVLDFVVLPRWNVEVELELDAEERSETWQLIVSEDGKQHDHCVTAITPGLQNDPVLKAW
jgi:pimeloyl-ACP methyl ester carboxylesterase